ncbi:hypothetical protein DSCA_08110 [Desulfosarcina alkanivorans]|uniref:Uncharacterized protein n=1 Tax=Desulfosarcina alkanivorans TaxID=571177 RepID=A0A5K7YJD7_9BACT|nr:hypothetical protein [Desulfosarcina alkanivorans]BBO66881.1 hypothetical protein DSCA_08110 [Desulfosarcina alkanivorans]
MSERTDSTKLKFYFLGAAVIIFIIAVFAFIISKQQRAGSLTIKIGDNEATMNIDENRIDFIALIKNMMENEENKSGTLAILRDSYGLYRKDSLLLLDDIRKRTGKDDFSKGLRELLFNLTGPFKREYHRYYNIELREVVEAINKLDYEHVVSKKFRELSDNEEGIFEKRPIDIQIVFSNSYSIPEGEAAIIRGRGCDIFGREWLLLNKDNPLLSPLSVIVVHEFPNIYPGEQPCIIINTSDAKTFLGENAVCEKRYNAKLFPVKKGYVVSPVRPQAVVNASGKKASKKMVSIKQHSIY